MKIINQQTSGRNIVFVIGLIIGWSMAVLPSLHATVITLTGGDAGEGFTPTNGLVYAYHFYGGAPTGPVSDPGPFTIQGVTFRSFNLFSPPSGFSTPSTFASTWSYDTGVATPNLGPSANDDALESMHANQMYYYGQSSGFIPAPAIVTLTGLRPGISYQVDLFSMFPTDPNNQDTWFTFNGSQTNHFTAVHANYYDVRENVIANGSSNIVVRFFSSDTVGGAANHYPIFNAFAVFELPEPSAAMLVGLGGLLMWRRQTR